MKSLVKAVVPASIGSVAFATPTQRCHYAVRALVAVAVDHLSGRRRSRRAAREHVIRFAWPALALPLPHPQSQLLGDSMPKDPR